MCAGRPIRCGVQAFSFAISISAIRSRKSPRDQSRPSRVPRRCRAAGLADHHAGAYGEITSTLHEGWQTTSAWLVPGMGELWGIFVAVGVALSAFMQVGLSHVASAIRKEQLTGTLESLLMTPTSTVTMQIGSVVYDLLYVPLRTAAFLAMVALGFGVHFHGSGVVPAAVLLFLFIPFVWGLGIASAASALTFRRGGAGISFGIVLLSFGSGAYFPVQLLPHWIVASSGWNPMAITVEGMRQALLAHVTWAQLGADAARLAPLGAFTLIVGLALFKRALRREQRRGTLGLY